MKHDWTKLTVIEQNWHGIIDNALSSASDDCISDADMDALSLKRRKHPKFEQMITHSVTCGYCYERLNARQAFVKNQLKRTAMFKSIAGVSAAALAVTLIGIYIVKYEDPTSTVAEVQAPTGKPATKQAQNTEPRTKAVSMPVKPDKRSTQPFTTKTKSNQYAYSPKDEPYSLDKMNPVISMSGVPAVATRSASNESSSLMINFEQKGLPEVFVKFYVACVKEDGSKRLAWMHPESSALQALEQDSISLEPDFKLGRSEHAYVVIIASRKPFTASRLIAHPNEKANQESEWLSLLKDNDQSAEPANPIMPNDWRLYVYPWPNN